MQPIDNMPIMMYFIFSSLISLDSVLTVLHKFCFLPYVLCTIIFTILMILTDFLSDKIYNHNDD